MTAPATSAPVCRRTTPRTSPVLLKTTWAGTAPTAGGAGRVGRRRPAVRDRWRRLDRERVPRHRDSRQPVNRVARRREAEAAEPRTGDVVAAEEDVVAVEPDAVERVGHRRQAVAFEHAARDGAV